MAVTHIVRVQNEKEGGEWASGDGDKKQTGEGGLQRQEYAQERNGTQTRYN